MVLAHINENRPKHSKAALAQVVEAPKGRDLVQRVVTIRYFKANSCRMNGNKMIGKPIYVTRGLETLSKLDQSALEQCKVSEYLHRNCKATEHDPSVSATRHPTVTVPSTPPLVDLGDPHAPLSSHQLDPDINTIVWVREDTHDPDHTQTQAQDHSQEQRSQSQDTRPTPYTPPPPTSPPPTPVSGRTDTHLEQNHEEIIREQPEAQPLQEAHPAAPGQQPQPQLQARQQVTRYGRAVKKNQNEDYDYQI